eukprot:TRINITY_DN19381_c0_g1_i1.p1 TRINITY_DN19381_c0_g1~~TRINITY_DN19381_c0_g1_i1.p1  ORF type:complete len:638 (-),score=131.99 TRINITY_DN19381_c0_g1_i1:44-1909(-)
MEKVDQWLPQYSFYDTVYITLTTFNPLVLSWAFYLLYISIVYGLVLPYFGLFYTVLFFLILPVLGSFVVRNYILPSRRSKSLPPRTFTLSSATFGQSPPNISFKNPATGVSTGSYSSYSPADVASVLTLARTAQASYSSSSTFSDRSILLSDLMQEIILHQSEICKLSMQDTGKTYLEALYGEILTSCSKLDFLINNGAHILADDYRAPPLWLLTKSAHVEYQPLGVIGIIVPWNYPFHNVLSAVITAIFAGNAAIVKVSEYATSSKDYFESLFRRVLSRNGYDPNLVTLVSGYGQTGEALIKCGIDHIFFIGSPMTGKKVMAAAVENLVPMTLELGGKDAFIVFDDVNIDHVIQIALRGVYVNNGQNCIASERIYVQSKIYNQFVQKIVEKVSALRSGASILDEQVDIGSMTMQLGITKILDLINDAVSKGAKLLAGGNVKKNAAEGTLFFEPTVLVDVTNEMKCVQEEAFGPLMLIMSFETEEEVIQKANDSQYGLGCSVFSRDRSKAERVGKKVRSGMVTVNDFGVGYLVQSVPFGGVGMSGFGKFNGSEGLRAFCNVKTVVRNRWGGEVLVPRFSQFPVLKEAREVVEGLIGVLYEQGARNKIRAVQKLQKNAQLLK